MFETVPDTGAAGTAIVFDRTRDTLLELAPSPGYDIAAPPVELNDDAAVLEHAIASPTETVIAEYDVYDGTRTAFATTPAAGAAQLLSVGGNLALVNRSPSGQASLAFVDAAFEPPALAAAARGGTDFTTDRTTLHWLTMTSGGETLWSWTPGDPAPRALRVHWKAGNPSIVGPYLSSTVGSTTPQLLLNSRDGRLLRMPSGTVLSRVDGNLATFLTTTNTQASLARLPANSIPDARC